jgi:3-isopropylmalate dehydrogenase
VDRVLDNPLTRTRDLGGQLGTDAFAAAVCAAISESIPGTTS